MSVATRRHILTLLLANAAALAALAAWGAMGWPGEANHCFDDDSCFCEAPRAGWIRQPANSLSSLGFMAVGLWAAARAGSPRAGLMALGISLLGPGSMALHASMTHWGGIFDVLSMFLFIAFPLLHDATLLRPAWAERFGARYAALACVLGCLEVAFSRWANTMFGTLIAVFAAMEAVLLAGGLAPNRDRRWLAAAAACFLAGLSLWVPSRYPDGALCSPDSLLQAHGAWHLLCACGAGALYRYLEPELT